MPNTTDEEANYFAGIGDGLVTAQTGAFSGLFVLRELMIDFARQQPDPQRYLRDLFDRVSRHVDRYETDGPKRVHAETQDMISVLFRDAEDAIRSS